MKQKILDHFAGNFETFFDKQLRGSKNSGVMSTRGVVHFTRTRIHPSASTIKPGSGSATPAAEAGTSSASGL